MRLNLPDPGSLPAGIPLATSLFFQSIHYTGRPEFHPATVADESKGHTPRWLVLLFEIADEIGCTEGELFREHLADGSAHVESDYVRRCARILEQHYAGGSLRSAERAFGPDMRVGIYRMFCMPCDGGSAMADAVARATRVGYPCGRYRRAPRTVQKEYMARCAQAMCVYDASAHGYWPALAPEALQARILKLSLHIAATRIVSFDADKRTDWLCRMKARAEIPFLLSACVYGLAAVRVDKTTWTGKKQTVAFTWNHLFRALRDGDIGDDNGRLTDRECDSPWCDENYEYACDG